MACDLSSDLWAMVLDGADQRGRRFFDPRYRPMAASVCAEWHRIVGDPPQGVARALARMMPDAVRRSFGATPVRFAHERDLWCRGRLVCASTALVRLDVFHAAHRPVCRQQDDKRPGGIKRKRSPDPADKGEPETVENRILQGAIRDVTLFVSTCSAIVEKATTDGSTTQVPPWVGAFESWCQWGGADPWDTALVMAASHQSDVLWYLVREMVPRVSAMLSPTAPLSCCLKRPLEERYRDPGVFEPSDENGGEGVPYQSHLLVSLQSLAFRRGNAHACAILCHGTDVLDVLLGEKHADSPHQQHLLDATGFRRPLRTRVTRGHAYALVGIMHACIMGARKGRALDRHVAVYWLRNMFTRIVGDARTADPILALVVGGHLWVDWRAAASATGHGAREEDRAIEASDGVAMLDGICGIVTDVLGKYNLWMDTHFEFDSLAFLNTQMVMGMSYDRGGCVRMALKARAVNICQHLWSVDRQGTSDRVRTILSDMHTFLDLYVFPVPRQVALTLRANVTMSLWLRDRCGVVPDPGWFHPSSDESDIRFVMIMLIMIPCVRRPAQETNPFCPLSETAGSIAPPVVRAEVGPDGLSANMALDPLGSLDRTLLVRTLAGAVYAWPAQTLSIAVRCMLAQWPLCGGGQFVDRMLAVVEPIVAASPTSLGALWGRRQPPATRHQRPDLWTLGADMVYAIVCHAVRALASAWGTRADCFVRTADRRHGRTLCDEVAATADERARVHPLGQHQQDHVDHQQHDADGGDDADDNDDGDDEREDVPDTEQDQQTKLDASVRHWCSINLGLAFMVRMARRTGVPVRWPLDPQMLYFRHAIDGLGTWCKSRASAGAAVWMRWCSARPLSVSQLGLDMLLPVLDAIHLASGPPTNTRNAGGDGVRSDRRRQLLHNAACHQRLLVQSLVDAGLIRTHDDETRTLLESLGRFARSP